MTCMGFGSEQFAPEYRNNEDVAATAGSKRSLSQLITTRKRSAGTIMIGWMVDVHSVCILFV